MRRVNSLVVGVVAVLAVACGARVDPATPAPTTGPPTTAAPAPATTTTTTVAPVTTTTVDGDESTAPR